MPRGYSKTGGELSYGSQVVWLNTEDADNLPCNFCGFDIRKLYKHNGERNRSNRVDCEGNSGLETYHFYCYDLLLFGTIKKSTLGKLAKL